MSDKALRFVLVGKTGSGKSSVANLLVGRRVCAESTSQCSSTKKCQRVDVRYDNELLLLVDTPGLYDTALKEEDTLKEIGKVMGITSPGFHGFILVMKIGNRFTNEEKITINLLRKEFGPEFYDRAVFLFTGLDDLEYHDKSFASYIKDEIHPDLQEIIAVCEGRTIGFNNRAKGAQRISQIEELIAKLRHIIYWKNNTHYTNPRYREVEQEVEQIRQERLKNDKEKTREQVEEEVRTAIENDEVDSSGWRCVII